jgi:hypothetical protein
VHPPGFLNVESSDLGMGEVSSWVRGKHRFVQNVVPQNPLLNGRIPGCLSGLLASLRPRRCSTCLGPSRSTGSKLCILGEDVTCGMALWEGCPSHFELDHSDGIESYTFLVTFPTGMAMSLPISRDHP